MSAFAALVGGREEFDRFTLAAAAYDAPPRIASGACCAVGSVRRASSRCLLGLCGRPRLSYVGIEPASVGTGGGNPALLEADRRLLPVSVVGCYFWVDRPLALFAHDQTKQFDIFITLTYIPEVLTAPVLVAFVVLGLRALNNQPLSRLQTTAVLAVATLAIAELLKVQLKFIFGAFATLTINVPPSRLTATLDDGHALRASSIACWVSQDGR